MKKILALGATALCALGVGSGVFATEITSPSQQSIEAEYTINSEFSVTIPTGIVFTDASTSVTETVSAENVFIDTGSSLVISMKSANGNLINGTDSYVPYSFTVGATTKQIEKETNYKLLAVTKGGGDSGSVDVTFTAGSLDNAIVSGRHADTLTFTVSIDSGSGGGTEEEPEEPALSDILVANSEYFSGAWYEGTFKNNDAYALINTHNSFISPQKVRVVVTDTANDVSTQKYNVTWSAWGADKTTFVAKGGIQAMTNGVIELDLPALRPDAAYFKVDVYLYPPFAARPATSSINVYKVED